MMTLPYNTLRPLLPKASGMSAINNFLKNTFRAFTPRSDLVSDLISKYDILNPYILKIVRNDTDLAKFLTTEAYNEIKKRFPEAVLALDLVEDLESGDRLLVIYIGTKSSPEDALERLRKLDEEWWLDKSALYKSVCIHLQLL